MIFGGYYMMNSVSLKAYRDYRRMPNSTLVVYVLVLAMDLVVGCSIIAWKCLIRKSDEECELAFGGTVGSVIIWLLIMLVCPFFATCVEICVILESCKKKCIQYKDKLRPRKSRDIVIQKEAHNSTTTTLLDQASPVDQPSNVHVFNETGRDRDRSAIFCYERDRAKHHITTFDEARNQTNSIKHPHQDVP